MDCMRDGFERGKLLDGRFLTISPLNHGSFGMVFAAKDIQTGRDVAIKCITKPDAVVDNTNCPAAIATDERSEELAIHSRLNYHQNIVNLIDHFETGAHQYMVLELCSNGDLYEAIRQKCGPLETEHVRSFMLQLVDAIDYLHSNGVYHRDIKPENIFLTSSGVMKLGDFGLATTETWSTEFAVGSDRYMAPEQFDSSVYGYGYSPASADVWAIGIVLLNVLFQRNPFTTPTVKDLLFADFARDRQSLFDVFPNMSQDTYKILVHSLALDPGNRSLGGVREALKDAVSFTIDDESLDDFCSNKDDKATVPTAAREPLRTPSIASPTLTSDSFPWTSALLKSPPQQNGRQLSTIPDEPELYPGSVQSEWHYADADEASLSSNVDSGLGMSYKSAKSAKSITFKDASNFVGSLPISFTKPSCKSASPYGANGGGFSKSWSDLWDEDEEIEEQQATSSFEAGATEDAMQLEQAKPSTPQMNIGYEQDRGSVTPRPALAETDANIRSASPLRKLIEHDKANPETPKQRSASILDKWSALGNFRRAKQEPSSVSSSVTATPTPQKTKYTDAFANLTPFSSSKRQKSQPKPSDNNNTSGGIGNGNGNAPNSSWRQGSPGRLRSTSMNSSRVWERKEKEHSPTAHRHSQEQHQAWSLDNNWREHKPRTAVPKGSSIPPVPPLPPSPSRLPGLYTEQLYRTEVDKLSKKGVARHPLPVDDIGDLEWVGGGWHDF